MHRSYILSLTEITKLVQMNVSSYNPDLNSSNSLTEKNVQCVPTKSYPLKSSASAACSNLNVLTP